MSGLRCIAAWWTCCLAAATAAAAEIDLGSGFVRSAAWEEDGLVRTVDTLTHHSPGTPRRRAPLPPALMPTLRPVPEPGSPPGPPPEHPALPAERCGPANPPPRL